MEEKKKDTEKKSDKRDLIIKILGIVALVLVVVIAIIMCVKVVFNQEKKLDKRLVELGKDFYENFYYEQVGSDDEARTEFLSKFSTIGIKVDLDNLARYKTDEKDEILKEFTNNKTKEACDEKETKVVIYPQDPYGKTDYNIETIIECGFKKKEDKTTTTAPAVVTTDEPTTEATTEETTTRATTTTRRR